MSDAPALVCPMTIDAPLSRLFRWLDRLTTPVIAAKKRQARKTWTRHVPVMTRSAVAPDDSDALRDSDVRAVAPDAADVLPRSAFCDGSSPFLEREVRARGRLLIERDSELSAFFREFSILPMWGAGKR